jgi:alpha-N-arabinofuranosidase
MAAVVRLGDPIGLISPRLYGTFAEHLGRCCYGGLWVGPSSQIPNVDGFHAGVIQALRDLPTPLVRWPGGCYADHYHWRDGIGSPAGRPGTLGTSCGLRAADDNSLGTHEFMRFCELVGAEPYLAGNVGTGSVQELCDWITYVNSDVDASLTRTRAANGRPGPWGVKLWGIGNEAWDCGGRYDAVSYAHEFRRYATMIDHVDPRAEMVAVGLEDRNLPESHLEDDWNEKFLAALGANVRLVDHLSVHKYWIHGGPETTFGESDYYALLAEAAATESLIERTAGTIARLSPGHRIGIALDEWGVWHPEAREWGPLSGATPRTPVDLEQANTLRDAIAAAVALEAFHRQCNVLSMANIAQVVNVLQAFLLTDETGACVKTPTYHAFALHAPHVGAEALRTDVAGSIEMPDGTAAVSATASRKDGGLAVTVINRHFERGAEVAIPTDGATFHASVLTAGSAGAVNSPAEPDRVSPQLLDVARTAVGQSIISLPAHSVATIEWARA